MSLELGVPAVSEIVSLGLSWLEPISLVTVVAMVMLELGKSLPKDYPFRRMADRATRPLVVLGIGVIVTSAFRLAQIIGFVG